jgi:uncharacterized repeat protein (TIGR02543 family)
MLSSAPPANASPVAYSVGAPVAGTVNTSGTTVTWVSGSQFNTSWDPGTQILINGVAYTIASVASTSSLTLSTSPPTLTGSPYSVGIILDDGNFHTVAITYTPTPTQSVSPNCFSGMTARPCIDVILDGIDLFGGGVYFDLTTLGLASGTNAWVGFTAGNAGGDDDEDILDWTFTPQSQSQTGTVTSTTPATYPYNGGCADNGSGCTGNGFTNTVGENPASTLTINNLVLTEIPIISGNGQSPTANQAACNAIVQAKSAFVNAGPLGQTAQCFVYQNGGGQGIDAPVMFAVSCPPSGICDTAVSGSQFFAAMASYFTFTCSENMPLICPAEPPNPPGPSSFGNFGSLTSVTGLPAIGFLQGAGPDPNNPCTAATGSNAPPLFQTNQIVSYTLGDTSSKPVKGGSGLLTSCWVATYDTPGEMPTASISGPTNGAIYQQGAVVAANYTCTSVSTDHDSILDPNGYPAGGPYLTVGTCSATSGLTAGGGTPTSSTCAPSSPYNPLNSSTYLDTCTATINLDTTDIGPQTLTVDAEDSATNTAQQQVTYTVVATYALTTIASPSAGGSVSPLSGGIYSSGTPVTVTETTSAGYVFTGWSGACSGTGACVVTMSGPETVTANFLPLYVLTTAASPGAGGSVSPVSGNSYSSGTPVTVTETANAGYVFTGWSGACSGTGACVVTMTGPESVTANFASGLTVSPSNIAFGTVYLGSITIRNITLTNSGANAVTINEPIISIVRGGNSDEFVAVSLCGKSLAAGKSCTITIAFLAGPFYTPQTATLEVMDSAPNSPQPVTLSATVIDPLATLNPASLSFGTVKANSSKTLNVTLSNPGATPLIFTGTGIGVTGANAPDFIETNNCGSSLAAGAKCNIAVQFTPPTTGSFSASLTVPDNALSGTQSVALSGKGD